MQASLEQLEDIVSQFKFESDSKKKHILYLNLVQESLKLVRKIVSSIYPVPVSVSREDLVQVGAIGLLKSIETYKIQEKGSFKTYASKFIRGKILQYLRDKSNLVKPPRDAVEKINIVRNYIDNFDSDNPPTNKEIAKGLNLSESKVEEILNAETLKNIISLDQSVYSSDGVETLADRIQAGDEDEISNSYENKKIIEGALKKLPADERVSIFMFYIEGETKKKISQVLNISQTQVSRLIKRALNRLYDIMKEDFI